MTPKSTGYIEQTPHLPKPGDRIVLFGLDVTVQYVEPETDWAWRIECRTDSDCLAVAIIPTPIRTTA